MNADLVINNLSFLYGDFEVGPVSISTEPGTFILIAGKNGAGKSTLLRGIMKHQTLSDNRVMFRGEVDFRDQLAYVSPYNDYKNHHTALTIEKYFKEVYLNWNTNVFHKLLDRFDINKSQKLKTMSLGKQQRLKLCVALSTGCKLLIFDEPTEGIDPTTRLDIIELIHEYVYQKQATAIFATHNVEDLGNRVDYLIYLDNGKAIYSGDIEALNDIKSKISADYGNIDLGHTLNDFINAMNKRGEW